MFSLCKRLVMSDRQLAKSWLVLSTIHYPLSTAYLAIQPQGSHPTAEVEGVVGAIVLHIGLPGARDRDGVRVHIVLLLCHISLNRKNKLPAFLHVLGAPLFLKHGRELRVVDIAPVHRMVGDEPAIQRAIWIRGEI